MPDTVIRGVATTVDVTFVKDGTQTPLAIVGGVSVAITTPNNLAVFSGMAAQDQNNPARWVLNFTIPKTAPVTSGDQKYVLRWRAVSDGQINIEREYFEVIDEAAPDAVDTSIVALMGQPFAANLIVPHDNLITLSLRIIGANGEPVISLGGLLDQQNPDRIEPEPSGSRFVYSVDIDEDTGLPNLVVANSGLTTYYAYFNYTDPSGPQTEVQPIYLANPLLVNMMNDMRSFVDMIRNDDTIVQLRITEAKLLHFAYQGLLRVNATSPGNFAFNFNTLALYQTFYFWVLKAAQYEILAAINLAEGMTAFDFQGMSVQLTSDRTQYISATMEAIKQDLDNMLPKVKSQFARAGGASGRLGAIGGVLGPASNWVFRANTSANWGGAIPPLPFLV